MDASPAAKRRLLLCCLVATSACASVAPEPEFYPPPTACPTGDRADWSRDPAAPRASRIRWVQVEPPVFSSACQTWRHPSDFRAIACAMTFPTPQGDAVGVVYSPYARSALPEVIRRHEECHTQGWRHRMP